MPLCQNGWVFVDTKFLQLPQELDLTKKREIVSQSPAVFCPQTFVTPCGCISPYDVKSNEATEAKNQQTASWTRTNKPESFSVWFSELQLLSHLKTIYCFKMIVRVPSYCSTHHPPFLLRLRKYPPRWWCHSWGVNAAPCCEIKSIIRSRGRWLSADAQPQEWAQSLFYQRICALLSAPH